MNSRGLILAGASLFYCNRFPVEIWKVAAVAASHRALDMPLTPRIQRVIIASRLTGRRKKMSSWITTPPT